MDKLTASLGSLLTSAAITAQAAPPVQEPVFNQENCTSPVYHGQTYKDVINNFSKFQKETRQPYNAAEGAFFSKSAKSEVVVGLDQLEAVKAKDAFAKDLKVAYIFTHAAGKSPTYFMLDNEAQTVCRVKPDTYFDAKKAASPPAP